VQQAAERHPALGLAVATACAAVGIVAFAFWQARRVRRVAAVRSFPPRPLADTTTKPLVSVVLPVWNGADFIQSALESIFAQTYTALEVIVVDDHSTDRTPEVLRQITDHRLRVMRLDRRVGGGAARNVGIQAARGSFVATMDADDVSDRQRIHRQVEFLRTHTDHALVACAFDCVDATGRVLDRVYPPSDDADLRRLLIRANPLAHSALLLRRDALEEVGDYDERSLAQDYDLYFRLARTWRLACLPEVLHRVRVHLQSETSRRENRICFSDVAARLAAIARGQYPIGTVRYLVHTAISMLVPVGLKRRRRAQHAAHHYRYYRRSVEWTRWEQCVAPDLRTDISREPHADVEDVDWRFLLPLTADARVLWLSVADPAPLLRTIMPRALVVRGRSSSSADAEPVVTVGCADIDLPFRDGVFDLVTVDLPTLPQAAPKVPFAELRRVLAARGRLHVGVPMWSPAATHVTVSWRGLWRLLHDVVIQRRRWRDLHSALSASGLHADTYARLPSFDHPRYLVRVDDIRSLQFLLQRLPTYTRVRSALVRPVLATARWLRMPFAPLAPGLSLVAHPEDP
jgi:glycosyltransferase involved in cell wall biosynthesis